MSTPPQGPRPLSQRQAQANSSAAADPGTMNNESYTFPASTRNHVSLPDLPETVPKRLLVALAVAILLLFGSAVLVVVAAGMPNWFSVNTSGYSATYGLFSTQTCLTTGLTPLNAPLFTCTSTPYTCTGTFCPTLTAFQTFTVLACILSFLALVLFLILFVSLWNGHHASLLSQRIHLTALATVCVTFLSEVLSLALWSAVVGQAGTPSTTNALTSSLVPLSTTITNGAAIPFESAGGYAASFYCMIAACLVGMISGVVGWWVWRGVSALGTVVVKGYGGGLRNRDAPVGVVIQGDQRVVIDGIGYIPRESRGGPVVVIDGMQYVAEGVAAAVVGGKRESRFAYL
ncbi:hypothetical protein HDU98_005755 [Podochytrium sp. JEL0797]|nr:hypothetical protein HDU98_005755 [Podochytrium sp. JEL0797]